MVFALGADGGNGGADGLSRPVVVVISFIMSASSPRVLLSSTFKPCGVDDMYGRKECVAEVNHNQLTQHQGIYSPRYWWPNVGIHLIAQNLDCEVTVLDWPTLREFESELANDYDYVGISFIHPTLQKFKKMAERTRELSPRSKIIAGGFGATIGNIERLCDIDHVCLGEGIRFMRNLLGQPAVFEFNSPLIHCEIIEFMGAPVRRLIPLLKMLGGDLASIYNNIIVTGLGCNNGCEFCSTSHFYDCAFLPFMRTGREIYEQMRVMTRATRSNAFMFLGDENFYIDKKRAEELWKLQRESDEEYVVRLTFGSVDRLEKYDPQMLAEMDVDHIWIGLESQQFPFEKSNGRDVRSLLEGLKSVGIKTILSSILFLDGHTKENIKKDIDFHLSLNPEHSQFAGLAVNEGTPLYERMKESGRLLESIPYEERHAFKQIWFWHPEFSLMESEKFQRDAYLRDFHELGPSTLRAMLNSVRAVPRLERSKSRRIKMRAARMRKEAESAKPIFLAAATAAYTDHMRGMILEWLREVCDLAGPLTSVDRAKAEVIASFARARKLRNRLWGDIIQPRTERTVYS